MRTPEPMKLRGVAPLLPLLLAFAGCIAQLQNAVTPPPEGTGTMTCRQIVEQCDAQCQDPLCVRHCGDLGTPVAAQQHTAVVDCAQRNACTDLACIRTSCPDESAACEGAAPTQIPRPTSTSTAQ